MLGMWSNIKPKRPFSVGLISRSIRVVSIFLVALCSGVSVSVLAKQRNAEPMVIPSRLPTLEQNQIEHEIRAQFVYLAKQLVAQSKVNIQPKQKFPLLLIAGEYSQAVDLIREIRRQEKHKRANASPFQYFRFELFGLAENKKGVNFEQDYLAVFKQKVGELDDVSAHLATEFVARDLARDKSYLEFQFGRVESLRAKITELNTSEVNNLVRMMNAYADVHIGSKTQQVIEKAVTLDRNKRYEIDTTVLITTDTGIELSAMIVRNRHRKENRPAILTATIYSDEKMNLQRAIEAAAHGYVGVVSDSRGKRLSRSEITPYENEAEDVTAVIDWISQQPWSDGRVGMYGGSYLGYTQWAAAKKLHPALKTIVPSVAIIPGQGLPKENGVFLNANYAWTEFVSTGRYNHSDAYAKNWFQVNQDWFKSGRAFNEYDQVAGKTNPWLQKWLTHPMFDKFWQEMVPRGSEYTKIDIPVLSLTGYYDDAQISAIEFVKDHFKYHPNPNHYLVIGPYDHFNVDILQQEEFRGYQLDPVAHIDMRKLTFDWFDYIFERGDKPQLLKNKLNYQLMDDNSWRHASSIDSLNQKGHKRYFSSDKNEVGFALTDKQASNTSSLRQIVDMKDRTKTYNDFSYPFPVVRNSLKAETGFTFSTEIFKQDMELSGTISGELKVKINKKDFDFGIVLFEQKADGKLHHLNYYIGRASHAKDPEKRQLLKQDHVESVPFEKARMISKKISKGSRLLVLLNVNFNPFSQVNYGTGQDVAKETIKDARQPLEIEWLNSSFIHLPLSELVD